MCIEEEKKVWTPPQLVEELKQRVIGQDEYLKDLCTTVWLQAMKKRLYEETETFYLNPKLNMLVLGKSGSGKTSTIQALASLLDLPVVVEDATMFTGTGWRGRDVASIIKDVVEVDIDPIRADYSIVVLDEIDKVFGHHTADSSFYAANNFLKMMEGTFLNYEEGGKHYQMDTSNLLFICLGAFDGLEDMIRKRLHKEKQIGFASPETETETEDLLRYATRDDLIKYGISPQFLGRISMITVMNSLHAPEYERILTEAKNSIVCQYDKLLGAGLGVRVSVTKAAAREIASRAEQSAEGARALAQEVAQGLKPGLYRAPGDLRIKELQLDYDQKEDRLALRYIQREPEEEAGREKTDHKWEEEWRYVHLRIDFYNLPGILKCAEEIVEQTASTWDDTYQQLKAATYMIATAILEIVVIEENLDVGDVVEQLKMWGKEPDLEEAENGFLYTKEGRDLFQKARSFHADVKETLGLAQHILTLYGLYYLYDPIWELNGSGGEETCLE